MPTKIKVTSGTEVFSGTLNDSETATKLLGRMPLSFGMSRWGEEYYGSIGKDLRAVEAPDARDLMELGELAFWIPGNAFCIFFGPTPASSAGEPRAASHVNPVGKLDGDFQKRLQALGRSITVRVEKA